MKWTSTAIALLAVAASNAAWGHGDTESVNDFYAGLLHPVLVPAHLMVLLASGLLVSQYVREHGQRLLAGMLVSLPAGLMISRLTAVPQDVMMIGFLVLGLVISLLVVVAARVPRKALLTIGLISGSWVGADSGHGNPGDASLFSTVMLGTWVGAMAVVCGVAGLLIDQQRDWQRLGIRVGGAWISAACILTLALTVRVDVAP
jgi:urease accessory protein